jgi:hypothetical protein
MVAGSPRPVNGGVFFSIPAELRDNGRMRFDERGRDVEAAEAQQRADDQEGDQLGYSAHQRTPAGTASIASTSPSPTRKSPLERGRRRRAEDASG